MHDDRDLDLLIDQALASYSATDPDPSLRARITGRVSEARPRSFRPWSIAALAACAVSICLLIYLSPRHPSSSRELSSATITPSTDPTPKRVPHPNEVRVGVLGPSPVPRRKDSAPHSYATPSRVPHPNEVRVGVLRSRSVGLSAQDSAPLTAEERALVQLTAERPREAQQLFAVCAEDHEPLHSTPLSFAPIHIADLPAPEPLHAD